jgi:hypothetical protein
MSEAAVAAAVAEIMPKTPPVMAHSRAAIEATMRAIFADAEQARQRDRELARRTGLSPTTVGAWRRRLARP